MSFAVDERLKADGVPVTVLRLCQVLLINDARFVWIVLVPQREGKIEIVDLEPDDQQLLMREIALASEVLRDMFQPHKLNVAALGNMVSQLHIHVIGRQVDDAAWPNPVWGVGESEAYAPDLLAELSNRIGASFQRASGV